MLKRLTAFFTLCSNLVTEVSIPDNRTESGDHHDCLINLVYKPNGVTFRTPYLGYDSLCYYEERLVLKITACKEWFRNIIIGYKNR